jgi:hypothetical protein
MAKESLNESVMMNASLSASTDFSIISNRQSVSLESSRIFTMHDSVAQFHGVD